MNRFYFSFLFLPLIVIFGFVVYLGYLGFVPGISHLFGSDKPRDLGIVYSRSDYDAFNRLAGTEITAVEGKIATESGLEFTGVIELNREFSQEQVSARINYSLWKYMPLTNFQIRFLNGNTLEFSGNLRMDRLDGFTKAVAGPGFTKQPIYNVLRAIELIPNNPPVFFKTAVDVTDNVVTVQTVSITIGKINLPLDQINTDMIVKTITETIMDKVPGFYANSVTFSEGVMNFSGTVPAREMIYLDQ